MTAVPGAPLPRHVWQERSRAHTARIDARIGTYLERRRRGRSHPVIDFLFTYYSARPTQVRRWHPGYGVALAGAVQDGADQDGADQDGAGGRFGGDYRRRADGAITVSDDLLMRRRSLLGAVEALLTATASRQARLGCFGLHEWAMVYRAPTTRHQLPLRLGAAGTDEVVESMPLRCTHYDAFRFFTPEALGRNTAVLSRATQAAHEQPGCLHATMDLYRYCLKLGPLIPGELLADYFELALDSRILDMEASPYDLTGLGYRAVLIETPAGRAEYVRRQSALARRGARLRERLTVTCRDLLHTTGAAVGPGATER